MVAKLQRVDFENSAVQTNHIKNHQIDFSQRKKSH